MISSPAYTLVVILLLHICREISFLPQHRLHKEKESTVP